MTTVDTYFDAIDGSRSRRARELSEMKQKFVSSESSDPLNLNSKAVIVLSYANWEGFYNDCVQEYVNFLVDRGKKIRETDWMLMVGALNADLSSLRDRNYSDVAKYQFVEKLESRLECTFEEFEVTEIMARSNLNFERLKTCYKLMQFDLDPLQKYRIRLDRELVTWRHEVAHGNPPDLSSMDIEDHVDFAAKLLMLVSDSFQYAILERS